jgi:pimeloyl-ACP methyl ester carboxylesterase
VRHFTAVYSERMNKRIDVIPPDTMHALVRYQWPGNARELQNFIERAVILSSQSVLRAPTSELEPVHSNNGCNAAMNALAEVERDHTLRALAASNWVISGAATRLEMKRTSLAYRIKKLRIQRPVPVPQNNGIGPTTDYLVVVASPAASVHLTENRQRRRSVGDSSLPPSGFVGLVSSKAARHMDLRRRSSLGMSSSAYEEGLGEAWGPIRKYWAEPTVENREILRQSILTAGGTRWQYTHGVANPENVPPESYTLDTALLERPGNKDIQLDLFLDYASNVKLYPKFQEYFRKSKPPLLAIWGKNDPFFIPAGAEAFRKDLPNAKVQSLDTGHFAIETHVVEIVDAMKDFLGELR